MTCSILRETPPRGKPFDLYVDPASGAYKRFVYDPEGEATTIDVDAYADVLPGKRVISAWHFEGSRYRHVDATIKANDPVTEGMLQPPAPRAKWTFGTQRPIRLEVTPDRIYVPATINGIPGKFILDTGSFSIALTEKFANKVKPKEVSSATFSGSAVQQGDSSLTSTRWRSATAARLAT